MSNAFSLYVADGVRCFAELTDSQVLDGEREFGLRDDLQEADADLGTFELSELHLPRAGKLNERPGDPLLPIVLWSWIDDGRRICDLDPDRADTSPIGRTRRTATRACSS